MHLLPIPRPRPPVEWEWWAYLHPVPWHSEQVEEIRRKVLEEVLSDVHRSILDVPPRGQIESILQLFQRAPFRLRT
jgi:hypothetical protein